MRYVHRKTHTELHPESQDDVVFLREKYGATGQFECWCVANKPEAMHLGDFAAIVPFDLKRRSLGPNACSANRPRSA